MNMGDLTSQSREWRLSRRKFTTGAAATGFAAAAAGLVGCSSSNSNKSAVATKPATVL